MRISLTVLLLVVARVTVAHADLPSAYSCSPGTAKIKTGCVCPTGYADKRDGENTAICKFVRRPPPKVIKKLPEDPDVTACNKGDAGLCEELSERYYDGTDGVTKDPKKAMTFLEKACNLSASRACNNLGTNWSDGKDGAPKVDHAKAAALYKKACELSNGLGCFNYGNVFREGEGVAVDKRKALDQFTRSCDLGEARGCTEEGIMYYEGDPVPKNLEKAADLLERACALGSKVGCQNVKLLRP